MARAAIESKRTGRGAMQTSAWTNRLSENVARVRAAIADACARSGRDPAQVHVVAVTKYAPEAVLDALPALGLADFGENYVQQLVARAARLAARTPPPAVRWHMIGHLQRNKVRAALEHVQSVHSLDSQRLAAALSERAAALGTTIDAFIEVNLAGEASKSGITPDAVAPLAEAVATLPGLRLHGLMTMAPYSDDPEASRPVFAGLRELLDRLRKSGAAAADCRDLSMGMSQDFVVAVEEGATWLRIGSSLFEGLPTADPRAT